MYDYIIIGSSISNLLHATLLKGKVLIIEKDNYNGGAWRIDCEKYKNIDLVGHLIVPTNDIMSNKICKFFKQFDIHFNKINNDDFIFETSKFHSNNKNGHPIICKNGWTDYTQKVLAYVNSYKNIKIINNCEVQQIICNTNYINIITKNVNFIAEKIIIPMYCNINNI